MAGSLFWKPYNARFDDLLHRLSIHSQIIKDEVLYATYRETVQVQKFIKDENLRAADARFAELDRKLDSISSSMFRGDAEVLRSKL